MAAVYEYVPIAGASYPYLPFYLVSCFLSYRLSLSFNRVNILSVVPETIVTTESV